MMFASISKPNGSPIGRQSTSSVTNNNASNNSSSSSNSSLVNLNSPQTANNNTNSSQNNNGSTRTTSGNLLQQLDYSQAFTAATTASSNSTTNSGGLVVSYHAAGQLSHQLNSNQSPHSHSTNLIAGQQTSLHNTHHNSHHSTQNATSNSIFTNSTNSHSHHHHHSNNSNLVLYNNDLPDTKEGLDELCPVCGDKVSGYHYGLLTCESCKGFFKRTVQNKKVYNCVAERQCHIDKSQRKRCPYCRFQKCLSVGMKLEAVRADRMRGGRNKFGPMYKRDRARRMQLLRQRQQHIVLNSSHSSLNSNASSANNSISTTNNASASAAIAAVCAGNLGHGQGTGVNEPFSLLNPGILYADGIKQELIQIPHLSSSTSSPDSSPSPLSGLSAGTGAGTGTNSSNLNNLSAANSNHQTFGSVAATHPELAKWVNSSMSSGVAGSAPSPLLNFNSSGSSGVRSLTVGLANSSLSTGSNNGLKQCNNSSFGFIENRNSALGPSFLATAGSSVLANVAAAVASSSRLPYVITELQLTAPNDKEWQSNLFSLLNEHTYNQCEVDLFDLMCKVIEKNLFAQVDWARNSIFFKELKIDDQMKLLQNSWSHLLVLDHLHQRIHHGLQDESSLPNGQKFNLISLALLGEPSAASDMIGVQNTLAESKFDHVDYLCLKFLLLLNPDVKGLINHRIVQEAQEQTQHALHQYTVNYYPQVNDKFNKLMNELPRLRQLTARGEEYLHFKHINGNAPAQTLLMEMLYARRK